MIASPFDVIDLTGTVGPGMWSYGPPLPAVRVDPVATLDGEGWKADRLLLTTLTGTYLETGDHLGLDQPPIAQVEAGRLVVHARVLQLAPKGAGQTISAADLDAADQGGPDGSALLVATGWDARWSEPGFVEDAPHFDPGAVDWLVARRPPILGVDVPSIQDPREDDGTLCRRLFGAGSLLLAPVVNLRQAGARQGTLVAAPLKVANVCGAPCRALLLLDNSAA